ncbi:conserved hypothetical protein [Aeropyrum pernix K1]|uniref:DUF432 domain-containing protein n=1 Tax=Aeropyrum pernix (strain ATCC 700893 / DSM 11879 / JCM 9820 / NBRC 100138 / K1) TaxID=272557 RepID=Q9YC09_AERPE|nr:DUF432 domain-containing protein [Aeropyrum pernix]BAA80439.1 conserved hypothetical protein [Aeropyrum pernix K1]
MAAGYGVPLEQGEHRLGSSRVVVETAGDGLVRYRREVDGGGSVELLFDGTVDLQPVPMYPIFKPLYVTRFILLRIEPRIVVSPGSERTFYTLIPVDTAIYAFPGDEPTIVDVIPMDDKPSLVLYGPPESGVVARLAISSVSPRPEEPSLGRALARIAVKNISGTPVTLSRILLDSAPLKLYFERGTWRAYTQELAVEVERYRGVVMYRQPFREGTMPISDPPEVRPPRFFQRTDMMWGV